MGAIEQGMIARELWWLAVMGIVMAVTILPYVLNRMAICGIWATLDNPKPDMPPLSPWAQRMKAAHTNSVENLVAFGPLAVAVVLAGVTDETTALTAMVFVIARTAYIVIYTLGIPVLRTLAFLVGWLCTLALALRLLAVI